MGAQRLFTSVLPKIRNRNTPPTTSSWVINVPGYLSKTSRCCLESLNKIEVFLLELMSPQTRTTVFLACFNRSFSLKTRWLKQLFDSCGGAQALTLFNSVILPDAACIRRLGSLMMDVKGSLQPIIWNCNAFITVSTVTSCSVNIMTKLGANVHTLIGVHTRRSFSAWWCTEAEKKSSFLLTGLKEPRLVHVHVRRLINSRSLTKLVKTIVNHVKLLQPNSSFSPALEGF